MVRMLQAVRFYDSRYVRARLTRFFANLPPRVVRMEARCGARY